MCLSMCMDAFIRRARSRGHWMPVNKLALFYLHHTIRSSGTHFPGENRRKIEVRIKQNCILFYFNIYIMQGSGGRCLWGKGDDRREEIAEIYADVPRVSVWISKIIQIWYGRCFVVVKIQKTLCGGRNTENLIESMCVLSKKQSIPHIFFKFQSSPHVL